MRVRMNAGPDARRVSLRLRVDGHDTLNVDACQATRVEQLSQFVREKLSNHHGQAERATHKKAHSCRLGNGSRCVAAPASRSLLWCGVWTQTRPAQTGPNSSPSMPLTFNKQTIPPMRISTQEHFSALLSLAAYPDHHNIDPLFLSHNSDGSVVAHLHVCVTEDASDSTQNALLHLAQGRNHGMGDYDLGTGEERFDEEQSVLDETNMELLDETSINFDDFDDSTNANDSLQPKDVIEILQDINCYVSGRDVSPVKSWVSREKNLIRKHFIWGSKQRSCLMSDQFVFSAVAYGGSQTDARVAL
ncbi:hypothetical protein BC830DRAFT_179585 [Chytriomyces sp. MP71]|nr:hypothetical protein BC830DRAFT_179585 [Chytriomyces sp. MP71]